MNEKKVIIIAIVIAVIIIASLLVYQNAENQEEQTNQPTSIEETVTKPECLNENGCFNPFECYYMTEEELHQAGINCYKRCQDNSDCPEGTTCQEVEGLLDEQQTKENYCLD